MAKLKVRIEKLPDGTHRHAGRFDNAKRWHPNWEYVLPGTFEVRRPTRSYPYSYLKHFYTAKYAVALARHNPHLYLSIQKIDPASDTGMRILAQAVAQKIGIAA